MLKFGRDEGKICIAEETITNLIRCTFRHFVRLYQTRTVYLPSDTEGCAEGFIFLSAESRPVGVSGSAGVQPINLAYAHNENNRSVTIYNLLRYEGMRIVYCINYR